MGARCFFCGEELKAGAQPERLRCGKCRADFLAKIDPEGCLLSLEVEGCGADDCCRHRKENRSS